MGVNHLSEQEFTRKNGVSSGLTILFPKTVGSTNTMAAEFFRGLPLLVATENQTAGRGTRGRSFESHEGKGLYISFAAYESDFKPDIAGILSPAVATVVERTLDSLYGTSFKIKWVNDIVINDKKLCGILCERKLFGGRAFYIIGIGINYEIDFLPDEIRDNSAGLLEITDNPDSNDIAAGIVKNILSLNESKSSEIVDQYRRLSSVLGREVYWSAGGEAVSVKAIDYDDKCNLVVSDGERVYTLNCGDVSVKFLK